MGGTGVVETSLTLCSGTAKIGPPSAQGNTKDSPMAAANGTTARSTPLALIDTTNHKGVSIVSEPINSVRFDYSKLSDDLANDARAVVGRIRDRLRCSIVETGND